MPKMSAGLLMFQRKPTLRVLLVHPGGPFFAKKDLAVWSIPKGEFKEGEDPLTAATREFEEELGQKPDSSHFIPLGSIKQAGGKIVQAWAFEDNLAITTVKSNTFEIEWPPKSGQKQSFPEVDKAQMFEIFEAKLKINPAQVEFLNKLQLLY